MPHLPDRDRLLAALPDDGAFITNREVREKLNPQRIGIGKCAGNYWTMV